MNGGIEELISGKQIIQSFGLEKVSTDHMTDLNTRLFTRERQSGFMGQLIMPLVNFINQIGYVLVAIQGGLFVLRGYITLGDIQAFFPLRNTSIRPDFAQFLHLNPISRNTRRLRSYLRDSGRSDGG